MSATNANAKNNTNDHGSDSHSNSSSSEDERRFLPKSRKGWQGDELELDHQRESFLEKKKSKATSAAVDISQFQNFEVGKGYQAKHVVRQQVVAGHDTAVAVKDMTTGATTSTTTSAKKNIKRKRESKSLETPKKKIQVEETPLSIDRLQKYLSSPGMVLFRGEIEDILSS